jgi:hypothetical protein
MAPQRALLGFHTERGMLGAFGEHQPDYLLPHRRAAWLVGAELLTDAGNGADTESSRDDRFESVASALRSHAETVRANAA